MKAAAAPCWSYRSFLSPIVSLSEPQVVYSLDPGRTPALSWLPESAASCRYLQGLKKPASPADSNLSAHWFSRCATCLTPTRSAHLISPPLERGLTGSLRERTRYIQLCATPACSSRGPGKSASRQRRHHQNNCSLPQEQLPCPQHCRCTLSRAIKFLCMPGTCKDESTTGGNIHRK